MSINKITSLRPGQIRSDPNTYFRVSCTGLVGSTTRKRANVIKFLFVSLQNGVIVSFSLVQSDVKSYHFYQNLSTNFHTYLDSIDQLTWLKKIEISFNWETSIKNHFNFFLFIAPNIDGSIANLSCTNLLFPVRPKHFCFFGKKI